MTWSPEDNSFRVMVMFLVVIPLLGYAAWCSYDRNTRFDTKAEECHAQCSEAGFLYSEFKWVAFTKGECLCQ